MARPTVGVEAQTVRAVGMIEARKRDLRARMSNGELETEGETALGMVRGLDEALGIIMLAVVTPEEGS